MGHTSFLCLLLRSWGHQRARFFLRALWADEPLSIKGRWAPPPSMLEVRPLIASILCLSRSLLLTSDAGMERKQWFWGPVWASRPCSGSGSAAHPSATLWTAPRARPGGAATKQGLTSRVERSFFPCFAWAESRVWLGVLEASAAEDLTFGAAPYREVARSARRLGSIPAWGKGV